MTGRDRTGLQDEPAPPCWISDGWPSSIETQEAGGRGVRSEHNLYGTHTWAVDGWAPTAHGLLMAGRHTWAVDGWAPSMRSAEAAAAVENACVGQHYRNVAQAPLDM